MALTHSGLICRVPKGTLFSFLPKPQPLRSWQLLSMCLWHTILEMLSNGWHMQQLCVLLIGVFRYRIVVASQWLVCESRGRSAYLTASTVKETDRLWLWFCLISITKWHSPLYILHSTLKKSAFSCAHTIAQTRFLWNYLNFSPRFFGIFKVYW